MTENPLFYCAQCHQQVGPFGHPRSECTRDGEKAVLQHNRVVEATVPLSLYENMEKAIEVLGNRATQRLLYIWRLEAAVKSLLACDDFIPLARRKEAQDTLREEGWEKKYE